MWRVGMGIVCIECGRKADGFERGWRGYVGGEPDGAEEDAEELVVFCPDCVRHEFGTFDAGLRPD